MSYGETVRELINDLIGGKIGRTIDAKAYLALHPDEGWQLQPATDKVQVEGWLVDPSMGEGVYGYNRKVQVPCLTTSLTDVFELAETIKPNQIINIERTESGWCVIMLNYRNPEKGYKVPTGIDRGPLIVTDAPTVQAAILASLLKTLP